MSIFLSLLISLTQYPFLAQAKVNPKAPQGGTFVYNIHRAEPPTLHPISENNGNAGTIFGFTCSHLLDIDWETNTFKPLIALKWEVSKDKLTYTFHLNPNAKFHDGTPITAEDVKFSTQIVSDPAAMALGREEIMDAIESIEVIDPLTVRMKAKELRYNLLDLMSHQVYIVPKAIYSITKNLQGMKKTLVCSGPYKFISWSPGQKIILQRFDGWSGNTMPEWKGFFNFEKIVFKFYSEPHLISEFAKKGEIDFSEIAPKDVDSIKLNEDPSSLSKFIKVENFQPPVSNQYAFNFRNPRFQSQKAREALAYALNRPLILNKIMSNNSSLMANPFGIHSPYADGTEKPRPFDLKKAKELLKQDGWADSDQNGILDKVIDGKKIDFAFTMTYGLKSAEPALTIFAEDLKSIGVEMKLQLLDSANFFDNLHKGHFDMAAFSWKATEVESDQKQIFHSASANGGSNYGNYMNPEVDKLIDEGRRTMDDKKRFKIFAKAGKMIMNDLPYIFTFESKYQFYTRSKNVVAPADMQKYRIGVETWWSADTGKNQKSQ